MGYNNNSYIVTGRWFPIIMDTIIIDIWLVVCHGMPTPLKNMSSSVGMMTFSIYGKIKYVPNHQPVVIWWNMNGMWMEYECNINGTWTVDTLW